MDINKYNVSNLVYYEMCNDINGAIFREKQIKSGLRKKKTELIESMNKQWKDIYYEF